MAPGSPAAEAGLLDGDRIVDFGGAKRLGDLPSRVQTAVSIFSDDLSLVFYWLLSGFLGLIIIRGDTASYIGWVWNH